MRSFVLLISSPYIFNKISFLVFSIFYLRKIKLNAVTKLLLFILCVQFVYKVFCQDISGILGVVKLSILIVIAHTVANYKFTNIFVLIVIFITVAQIVLPIDTVWKFFGSLISQSVLVVGVDHGTFGVIGHRNIHANLLFLICLGAFLQSKYTKERYYHVLFITCCALLLTTGSKTSLIVSALSFLIYVLTSEYRMKGLLAPLLVTVIAFGFFWFISNFTVLLVYDYENSNSYLSRFDIVEFWYNSSYLSKLIGGEFTLGKSADSMLLILLIRHGILVTFLFYYVVYHLFFRDMKLMFLPYFVFSCVTFIGYDFYLMVCTCLLVSRERQMVSFNRVQQPPLNSV